ncbi:MAG: PVC-type heme-binding CxxCH protein [Planctomycetota bacterium]
MKWTLLTCLGTLLFPKSSFADDTNLVQSPTRPAPAWLKLEDQGSHSPGMKGLILPKGFKVEVVATEPVVVNPVGMTFDKSGTFYVLEWPVAESQERKDEKIAYKDGTSRLNATMKKSRPDIVKVLADKDGDGVFEAAEIIIGDSELPSSILVHDGWVYLSGRGSVFRYRQSKENGPYDVKEEILRGFCGYHHHQASGLTVGPDGLLYVTSGDNDNYGEGSDGTRVTTLRTGVIFRCKPDGSELEEYAIGFRNPYRDAVYDERYNMFHVDNDNEDGSKFMGCRLLHIAEGADYGWRLFPGAICCRPDHARAAVNGELPGKLPFMLKTGRGSPAGLMYVQGQSFPKEYQGLFLYPDVYRKLIRAYRFSPQGATFGVTEEFEFMRSDDPLFRPCQCALGPDGAIYVCDWRTDSGGAGRLSGDGVHGRIYRIRWVGDGQSPELPLRPMDVRKRVLSSSDENLVDTVRGPDFDLRQIAQLELVRRGRQDLLLALLNDPKENLTARIHALVAQTPLWNDAARAAVLQVSSDSSADLRRLAADILGRKSAKGDQEAIDVLSRLVEDKDPAVRRVAVLAIAKVAGDSKADLLQAQLTMENGKEPFLVDAYVRAFETMGPAAVEKLAFLAASKDSAQRALALDLFHRFRGPAAAKSLQKLIAAPALTAKERADLIRSYRNYQFDPPLAIDGLVEYLDDHPDAPKDVQLAVLEVLGYLTPKDLGRTEALLKRLMQSPDVELRHSAIRAIGAAKVVSLAGDLTAVINHSNDRADRLEALRVIRELMLAKASEAVSGLAKNNDDTEVQIESLRTLAAIDGDKAAALAEKLLAFPKLQVQEEAIRQLGNRFEGAKLVANRYLENRLPRESLPIIAEILKRHEEKHPEATELIAKVMKGGLLIALTPAEAAKIERMVQSNGDPVAGRNIFTDAKQLQCIRCHKMENIGDPNGPGPALNRLWETHSIPKILESILEPSKEIKEGYTAYVVADTEGRVLTGLLTARSDDGITLKDSKGTEYRIARPDIEELRETKTSLMPENVVANLTYQQFIDLIAFLKSKSAQEGLKRYPGQWWVAGPFGTNLDAVDAAQKQLDVHKRIEPENDQSTYWEPASPDVNGKLDFRKHINRDHSSAYALCHLYSEADQEVSAKFRPVENARLWVNGSPIKLGGEISLPFKKGWNRVLVKCVTATGPHEFEFQLGDASGVRFGNEPE